MDDDPSIVLSVQSLLDERHTLTQRSLVQPAGSGQWAGSFRSSRRGQGTDFDDLRHYTAGDDLRHIDWKASARTNELHTRLYREEKEHRVTIVVDIRQSMFCGSAQLRAVQACRLAARLLWQAIDNGSRASVITLTDEGLYATEHTAGHKAAIEGCGLLSRRFLQVRQDVMYTHPNHRNNPVAPSMPASVNSEHSLPDLLIRLNLPTDKLIKPVLELDTAMQWLLRQTYKTHSLLWVSGMDDCGEHFESSLEHLSQLTTQAAIYISDPILSTGLPGGRYAYLSRNHDLSTSTSTVTLSYQASKKLRRALQQAEQQLKHRFERLQIPFLSTADDEGQIINSLRHHGYLP